MTDILQILQHALGRNEYGQPRYPHNPDFRNHFCTGPGSRDFDQCRQAVVEGLMTERAPSPISGGDSVFFVTEAGKAYIRQHSPKPPKKTRSQLRYQRYLEFGGWFRSFREFLDWDCQQSRGDQP